jgi:hypothetical protein
LRNSTKVSVVASDSINRIIKEELTIDKRFSYSGLIHLFIISKLSDALSSNFTYITIKICSNIMFELGERTNIFNLIENDNTFGKRSKYSP